MLAGGGREAAVLRDAAMADAALSNQVAGRFHYVVLALKEKEGGTRGGSAKEQDSNANEDDDDSLVVARA